MQVRLFPHFGQQQKLELNAPLNEKSSFASSCGKCKLVLFPQEIVNQYRFKKHYIYFTTIQVENLCAKFRI